MPTVTNRKTKVSYHVSNGELEAILGNPLTAKMFTIAKAETPDEVVKLLEPKIEKNAEKQTRKSKK